MEKLKVKEFIKDYCKNVRNVYVTGSYNHGLVTLYNGSVDSLLNLIDVERIITNKNWGYFNEDRFFY